MPTVTVSPFGSFATGASPNQSAQLAPGQVIDALVLSLIKDTTFRLQLPTGTLDIQTDIPLVPGTRVELAVEGSASQPRLVVTPLPDGAKPAATANSSTQTQAMPAAAPADNVGQAAATLVRDAATRQGAACNCSCWLARSRDATEGVLGPDPDAPHTGGLDVVNKGAPAFLGVVLLTCNDNGTAGAGGLDAAWGLHVTFVGTGHAEVPFSAIGILECYAAMVPIAALLLLTLCCCHAWL